MSSALPDGVAVRTSAAVRAVPAMRRVTAVAPAETSLQPRCHQGEGAGVPRILAPSHPVLLLTFKNPAHGTDQLLQKRTAGPGIERHVVARCDVGLEIPQQPRGQ